MAELYQILLIEDNESDAELIQLELNKLDIDVDIQTIHKKNELSAHLKDDPPDLIISDYKLSGFTGIDALHIVREQYPKLPFILVSGYIEQEQAVDIMLEGASDYAMKNNLERLRAAVTRELQNYEQHLQNRQQLQQKEQQLQTIIDSVEGIVWEADAQTFEFHYVSSQVQKLLGYTPVEWLDTPNFWQDHIHPDDRHKAVTYCQRKARQGENHEFEYRIRNASGNYVWLRDYVTVVTQNSGPNQLRGIMVDITQQKETERQRDNAYQIADIGHWELDLVNEELLWSDTVKKLHGVGLDYNPDLDTAIDFYKKGEDRQTIREAIDRAIETGASFDVELRIITAKGNQRWIRAVGETEFHNGQCTRIYGSTQDITDRKVSEKKYQDTFNLSPQPMWLFDPRTLEFLEVNQAAVNHYGYSREEFLNMTLKDIRPEKEVPKLIKAVQETDTRKDTHFKGEFRHKTKDGTVIDVSVKRNNIDYQGRKVAIVLAEDITERKRNEERIKQINERFEKVTEATNDAIWDFDVNEDDLFWGKGFETLFGYDLDEIDPTLDFVISLIHPEDRGKIVEKVEEYMQPGSKTDWYEEYRFRKANGTYAPVMDRAVFIRNKSGEVVRVVGAMTDLTRQKENEKALRKLNKELEQQTEQLAASNAELEQFAYVASHDLQEPLRMVSSFLNRLERKYNDQLDEKAQQYINFAVDGANRMRRIILDLLNYSHMGNQEIEREKIQPEKLLEEIVELQQSTINETSAKIKWDGLPTFEAAQTLIRQVFKNLINNAIKYRKPGINPEIVIQGEENEHYWQFSVSDNGIGIHKEFQENIFTIFKRLHTQDEYSGTGIGLSVAQKIVKKHRGEIWVESEEGQGSTFYFTIAKEY